LKEFQIPGQGYEISVQRKKMLRNISDKHGKALLYNTHSRPTVQYWEVC
jgi:hypothetical protein